MTGSLLAGADQRAIVTVYGRAAHSGSSHRHGSNAARARRTPRRRSRRRLRCLRSPRPTSRCDRSSRSQRSRVAGVFRMPPDACSLNVDIRLTTTFTAALARHTLAHPAVEVFDVAAPEERNRRSSGFPAGRRIASTTTSRPCTRCMMPRVRRSDATCPPASPGRRASALSSATLGVPATSGFGVDLLQSARARRVHRGSVDRAGVPRLLRRGAKPAGIA